MKCVSGKGGGGGGGGGVGGKAVCEREEEKGAFAGQYDVPWGRTAAGGPGVPRSTETPSGPQRGQAGPKPLSRISPREK